MLTTIKQRLGRDDEQGFTLIELMVVVLIIAILLAIAIPTFLGAKSSANARAAQSNARNALTAEQTVFTDGQVFSSDTAAGGVLLTAEPNLGWTTVAPSSASAPSAVGVVLGTKSSLGDTVYLSTYGKDGNCYMIQQVNDPSFTGATTGYGVEKGACTGATADGSQAPTTVLAGKGSANKSAVTVFPTFYTSW